MKLYEFPSGDTVHKYKKSIVISFKGKRNVLSTGPNNGGFTTVYPLCLIMRQIPEMAWRLNFGRILTGAYGYFSKWKIWVLTLLPAPDL